LHARHQRAEDRLPLVVGEPCRIGERATMGVACRVRPEMMAVRREMDTRRRRSAKLAEVVAQIERHGITG
jgi:hypothetical protein